MNKLKFTKHASSRMQQRAIDDVLVGLILNLGKKYSDGKGCTIYGLTDRKQRHRVASALRKKAEKLEKQDGLFAVESKEGALITLGYQDRRFTQLKNSWSSK